MPFHLRTSIPLTPEQWRVRGEAIQAELEGLSIEELLRGGRNVGSSNSAVNSPHRQGYDPNQPRVPAGHSDGGQWTSNGRSGTGRSLQAFVDTGTGEGDDEFLDAIHPRARVAAARVTADYSKAFT